MPWQCRLLTPEETKARSDGHYSAKVGEMWFADWRLVDTPDYLSPKYYRDWGGKRPPIDIQLPCGEWCIDSRTISGGEFGPDGWAVTGTAPLITVHPSIHIVGAYHGWLKEGVLSDSCC